jgi:hypothetical protein
MTTQPHTHYCPHCEQQRPCTAAEDGGCIFPATSPLTCEPCAARPISRAAAVLGRKGGRSTSPAKLVAAKRNAAYNGRAPRVPYTTRRYGTPFGCEGERSEDVPTLRAADRYARSALLAGQSLDVLRGDEIIARWTCGPDGVVGRVNL